MAWYPSRDFTIMSMLTRSSGVWAYFSSVPEYPMVGIPRSAALMLPSVPNFQYRTSGLCPMRRSADMARRAKGWSVAVSHGGWNFVTSFRYGCGCVRATVGGEAA